VDVIAHGLWAGAAGTWLARRNGISVRSMAAWSVALAAAPDLVQMLPVLAWSLTQEAPISVLYAHIAASPGEGPALLPLVHALSHHAHCAFHSVVVAAAVTLIVWRVRPGWLIPLTGWWLHILMDIPTHSSDYYPVPFLYPLTYWSISGVAWTAPWMLALNYAAIALVYAGLFLVRHRREA
jgi:hypothetical protein